MLGAAISVLLLRTGLSARLRALAEHTTRFKSLQVGLYAVPYVLIVSVLSFPLGVYSDYFRERAYGLATQTFGPWFREQLIGLGVALIATAILMMALYAAFGSAQRTWWLWGTAMGVVLMAVAMLIVPVFVAPLFNTYKPLVDRKIGQPILAMASANEIPVIG